MASPKFTITHIDGTEKIVPLRPRAQVQFEEETGEPLVSLSSESMRVTQLYRLAWFADGQPGKFEDWLDTLDSVDLEAQDREGATDGEDDDTTRPTQPDNLPD